MIIFYSVVLVVAADGILWKIHVAGALQYYQELSDAADSSACPGVGVRVVDVAGYDTAAASRAGNRQLPDWLRVVFRSPLSYSRFMGVGSIPSANIVKPSSSPSNKLKNGR